MILFDPYSGFLRWKVRYRYFFPAADWVPQGKRLGGGDAMQDDC